MNDLITNNILSAEYNSLLLYCFCICFFSWFLGYALRLVISLLHKIKNAI